jgi:HlyD family secretion protein
MRLSPLSLIIATHLALTASAVPSPAQTTDTPAQVLPAITVATVETRHLRDIVLASGLIAPLETIQVAPLIEGQPIEALLADVGDKVAAGQVLAKLSNSTLTLQKAQANASLAAASAQIAQAQAQMIEAQSSADEAKRTSDRTATLRKQGTASQAAADTALAGAVSATARVAVATQSLAAAKAQEALVQAHLQLSRTEVTAPFAGEITARNAQLGAIASAAGQPMFTLIRDGALELRADIAESDLTRLALGQTADLRLVSGHPPIKATIRLIEPSIDATTRLGRARLTLADPSQTRPGMFVEATILVGETDAIAVPVTALKTNGQDSSVMLVKDGIVSLRKVSLGIRDAGLVQITQGLQAGDQVVLKAGAFVRDGDHINPIAAPTN